MVGARSANARPGSRAAGDSHDWRALGVGDAGCGQQRAMARLQRECVRDRVAQVGDLALAGEHEQRQRGHDRQSGQAEQRLDLGARAGRGRRARRQLHVGGGGDRRVSGGGGAEAITGSVCSAMASITCGETLSVSVFSIQ